MAGVPAHMRARRVDVFGRPRATVQLTHRVLPETHAALQESARKTGMSITRYLEDLILADAEHEYVPRAPDTTDAEQLPLTG